MYLICAEAMLFADTNTDVMDTNHLSIQCQILNASTDRKHRSCSPYRRLCTDDGRGYGNEKGIHSC